MCAAAVQQLLRSVDQPLSVTGGLLMAAAAAANLAGSQAESVLNPIHLAVTVGARRALALLAWGVTVTSSSEV